MQYLLLIGHTHQEISYIRRMRIKPSINSIYAPLCDLDYSDNHPEHLFGDNISKGLTKLSKSI